MCLKKCSIRYSWTPEGGHTKNTCTEDTFRKTDTQTYTHPDRYRAASPTPSIYAQLSQLPPPSPWVSVCISGTVTMCVWVYVPFCPPLPSTSLLLPNCCTPRSTLYLSTITVRLLRLTRCKFNLFSFLIPGELRKICKA